MLSRSCSAPVLGSLVISPHSESLRGGAELDFGSPVWTPWKLVSKSPRCSRFTPRRLNLKDGEFECKVPGSQRFRRAQSDNNLVNSVKTTEATTHGIANRELSTTPAWSKMHELGLLSLEWMACYPDLDEVTEEESDDPEVSDNPAENSVPSYHIQLDENPAAISTRVSGNSGVPDGEVYSSVRIGSNGVASVCRTRGSKPEHVSETDLEDGIGIGKGGRKGMPGGGGGGSSDSADIYYQKMLEANPGNPLLLRNYAKFLHEVRHDTRKAEEYYGRAILASPGDGEVLSLYAKLIWEGHRDPSRAKAYFDQAVQASPDDCYVIASYAHFLWNSKDEEEDDDDADPQHNVPGQTFVGSASVATC